MTNSKKELTTIKNYQFQGLTIPEVEIEIKEIRYSILDAKISILIEIKVKGQDQRLTEQYIIIEGEDIPSVIRLVSDAVIERPEFIEALSS